MPEIQSQGEVPESGANPPDQPTEVGQEKKPPKPEEKPFNEFITDELLPGIAKALEGHGINKPRLHLEKSDRPVVGGQCWLIVGELPLGRRFWLCFTKDQISSAKTIAIAEPGTEPSILESFLIDEKKITKSLLISRLLQRLNGQKWLGAN